MITMHNGKVLVFCSPRLFCFSLCQKQRKTLNNLEETISWYDFNLSFGVYFLIYSKIFSCSLCQYIVYVLSRIKLKVQFVVWEMEIRTSVTEFPLTNLPALCFFFFNLCLKMLVLLSLLSSLPVSLKSI